MKQTAAKSSAPVSVPDSPSTGTPGANRSVHYADLPEIEGVLPSGELAKARDLLEELELLGNQIHILNERWDEAREELTRLQQEHNLPGLRHGRLAFAAIWMPGRRTLDRTKLIEAGVTVEQLEAGIREGEGYWMRTFKVISPAE